MINIIFKFSCDEKSYEIQVKSTEIIREAFQRLVRSKPEYYLKLKIKEITLKENNIDPDDTFLEVDASDKDIFFISCNFKEEKTDGDSMDTHTPTPTSNPTSSQDKKRFILYYKAKPKEEDYYDDDGERIKLPDTFTNIKLFGDIFYYREHSKLVVSDLDNNRILNYKNHLKVKDGESIKIMLYLKENVIDFGGMFDGCEYLTKIEGEVDTSTGKNFKCMFRDCKILEDI
jgi:hypothetical protein